MFPQEKRRDLGYQGALFQKYLPLEWLCQLHKKGVQNLALDHHFTNSDVAYLIHARDGSQEP